MKNVCVGDTWLINRGIDRPRKPGLVTSVFSAQRTVAGKGWNQGQDTWARLECPSSGEKYGTYKIEYLVHLLQSREDHERVKERLTRPEPSRESEQPGLFDMPTQAEALKGQQDGLQRSTSRSGEDWLNYAKEFLRVYLLDHEKLFCDDVWDSGLERPASPRAFGAAMKHAKKCGWMEEAGESRKSKQAHMAIRVVYRSLICRSAEHINSTRPR